MSQPGATEQSTDGRRSQRTGKELKPHRCNDRVEDWVQSLYTLEWGAKIKPAWRNMRACLSSEIGYERQHISRHHLPSKCLSSPSQWQCCGTALNERSTCECLEHHSALVQTFALTSPRLKKRGFCLQGRAPHAIHNHKRWAAIFGV